MYPGFHLYFINQPNLPAAKQSNPIREDIRIALSTRQVLPVTIDHTGRTNCLQIIDIDIFT